MFIILVPTSMLLLNISSSFWSSITNLAFLFTINPLVSLKIKLILAVVEVVSTIKSLTTGAEVSLTLIVTDVFLSSVTSLISSPSIYLIASNVYS